MRPEERGQGYGVREFVGQAELGGQLSLGVKGGLGCHRDVSNTMNLQLSRDVGVRDKNSNCLTKCISAF